MEKGNRKLQMKENMLWKRKKVRRRIGSKMRVVHALVPISILDAVP